MAMTALAGGMPPEDAATFATPEQASQAVIAAAERHDVKELERIFGEQGIDLVVTEDPVLDKSYTSAFAALAREQNAIVRDPGRPGTAILVVGDEDWPMPIPIVERDGRWSFDTEAGRQEILWRRIGRNELDAIEVCRGYVEAQHEYALTKHDGASVNQYAQRIVSTAGKHDGLAWKAADGTWEGPVGEAIARVIAEGYTERLEPYHGYYFKILKGQGPSAPLGAMDFVVRGAMIGGFALAAAPADYGVTGVKSFVVSHDAVVYEKDLGPDTHAQFKAMTLYDPDETWQPVEEP
jgi:hypothetical protein